MVDRSQPDIRPNSSRGEPVPRSVENSMDPCSDPSKAVCDPDAVRCRLLKMIVQNEASRKPKLQ